MPSIHDLMPQSLRSGLLRTAYADRVLTAIQSDLSVNALSLQVAHKYLTRFVSGDVSAHRYDECAALRVTLRLQIEAMEEGAFNG